jgi:hypothetical protein
VPDAGKTLSKTTVHPEALSIAICSLRVLVVMISVVSQGSPPHSRSVHHGDAGDFQ